MEKAEKQFIERPPMQSNQSAFEEFILKYGKKIISNTAKFANIHG